MPRLPLDEDTVARFSGQSGFGILWDANLWGFGCRLSSRERPKYFVYFRTKVMGVPCRYMIGSSRHLSCGQARRIAQEFIARSAPHQLSRKASVRT